MRREAVVYACSLVVAAVGVFSATYFFGRHTTLEEELERLASGRARAPVADRKGGIPSLQQREEPPAPQLEGKPEGEPLGEGILAVRAPLEQAGMVLVVDLPALVAEIPGGPGGGRSDFTPLRQGLEAFLARPPAGLAVGLRALAGAGGECGGTDLVRAPGPGGAGELAGALEAAHGLGLGPRNPLMAAGAAAGDLGVVPGEHAIVILAGDAEGCVSNLCGADAPPGGAAARVHLLLLAQPPEPGAEPDMPEAGTAATPAPVFDPPWAAPYRCLAERTGGTVAAASTAAELEGALRRLAADLEAAVAVRAFRGTGEEIRGISPGGAAGWGVLLRPAGEGGEGDARMAELFPASFSLPGGVYVLKGRYGGQEKTAAVAVAPGERAEVRISFPTGELFVQALDAGGGEIVGDSAGFRCAWGTEVLQGGEDTVGEGGEDGVVASTCSFPSRLELAPGVYRVRARWKGLERSVEEVAIEGGASTVRVVSFGAEGN
jgi:hypothetical protein